MVVQRRANLLLLYALSLRLRSEWRVFMAQCSEHWAIHSREAAAVLLASSLQLGFDASYSLNAGSRCYRTHCDQLGHSDDEPAIMSVSK
jgi:hypothetical protein